MNDKMGWKTETKIYRFRDPDGSIARASAAGQDVEQLAQLHRGELAGIDEIHGNIGCNAGIQLMIDAYAGLGAAGPYDNAKAHIGAGDGNGSVPTVAATDIGLAATANKIYVAMDAGYPQRSGQTITFRATFGPGVGTWHWRELAIRNAANESSGAQLNHLVYDKGEKGAGDTFIPVIELTHS